MSWHLFDRIRAFAKSGGIFQQERVFQDQSQLDRVLGSGELYDFNQQQALLDQTNLQINRLERYKDYEQMDEVGEVSLALDLYADESSSNDPERKHTIIIKARSQAVKRELEELYFGTLMIDNSARNMARYLCKYGDFAGEIVPNVSRRGVAAIKFMNIYNFTRVETKYGDLIGFYYQDEVMQEPVFLHPWQVMHMRLTSYENLYHPYGRSILEGGRKAFKQLRLMEDAALIYRITRAPEKRIFKIPVGQIPTKEVPEYIQAIGRQYKNQRFYDPRTGTFNERYSPLIQEDDFFLPKRPDGSGPEIDILKGAANLDDIKDIEYFKKKMIAPMKIPFKRAGIGDGAGESNERSLSSGDSDFAHSVQWVQREIATMLTKVGICHLAMAGYPMEEIKNFSISMSATNAIDELYRIETWSSRVGVMADLKDLGWFPAPWIITRFTDLSPDEIQELPNLESGGEGEGGPGGPGGPGGGGPPDLGAPGGPEGGLDGPGGPEGGGGGGGGPDGGPEGEEGGDDDLDLSGAVPSDPNISGQASEIEDELGNIGVNLGENKITGYDYAAEKRMLLELKKTKEIVIKEDRKKKQLKILVEHAARVRDSNHVSPINNFVERHELDGLPRGDKTLVKCEIPSTTVMEARNEYHKALCGTDDPNCSKSTIQE